MITKDKITRKIIRRDCTPAERSKWGESCDLYNFIDPRFSKKLHNRIMDILWERIMKEHPELDVRKEVNKR